MELGAFIIEAKLPSGVSETRNASFKSITLRQDGNASSSSLSNIVLERNGKTVASNPTINGRDLTFSLSDTILDSTFATYYIKAVVNNVEQATDTYTFVVRNASDVNVVEANTAFRTVVTPNTITLKTYNIQGGDLTFARDTTVALSSNVAPGTTNVVLMKGTLKSNSSVTLENPSINYGSNDVANDSGAFAMFSTVYLQIGSSTFSYSPSTSTGVTTAKFLGTATVNGTVAVKMWATLKQTAPKGTIKFASLGLENFLSNNGNNGRAEYSANGNTIKTSIGSIQSNSVVVEKTSLNTVNIDNKGNSKVAKGTSDFTVMKLAVTSTEGNGVRLSRAAFDVAATGSVDGSVTLSLYVNGSTTPVQTKNVKVTDTSVAFDNFTANVTSASGATLEVKASFLDSFATGSFKLTLGDAGLNAVDMLTSVPVKSNVIVGSTFSIGSASAKFTASNSPIKSKLLLSPSTSEEAIITFRIKAIDDTVKLSDVAFTGTNITNLTNIKLVDSSNKFVAAPTSITSTGLVFSNISTSVSPAVVKDNYATYSIVADVKSYTTGILNLNLESASIRSSNSDLVTATQEASTATVSHILAESSFVISAAGTAKSFASNVLSFKVNAMGKESTILT